MCVVKHLTFYKVLDFLFILRLNVSNVKLKICGNISNVTDEGDQLL